MSALGQKQTFAVQRSKKDRYSITSLVISRTSRLIVRPSSFAVFRFMTSSKLVG